MRDLMRRENSFHEPYISGASRRGSVRKHSPRRSSSHILDLTQAHWGSSGYMCAVDGRVRTDVHVDYRHRAC
jgi:hypothetical protein